MSPMTSVSPITSHVLDTASGRPVAALTVRLERRDEAGNYVLLAERVTDGDGRVRDLMEPGGLTASTYRMTFLVGEYFARSATAGFYPEVQVTFEIRATDEHYHVPLLLSPFGYSTYRGT